MHRDKLLNKQLEEALIDFLNKLVDYLLQLPVADGERLYSEALQGVPEVLMHLPHGNYNAMRAAAVVGLLPLMRSCLISQGIATYPKPETTVLGLLEHEMRRIKQLTADIDWRANTVDVWGQAYNAMLKSQRGAGNGSTAKRTGAFFTPTWIVEHLLNKIPAIAFARSNAVLDPACGTGAFLMACWMRKKMRMDEASTLLFGIDTDGVALAIANYNLLLRGTPSSVFRLYCADALEMFTVLSSELVQETSLVEQNTFPSHFDIIVGNPPYGAEVSPWLRRHVKKAFTTSVGHIDSYRLFLELILRKLGTGGYLALVLSRSWMSIPSARKLRELFLSTCSPMYLGLVAEDAFRANVDTAIVVAREKSQANSNAKDIEVASIGFDNIAGKIKVKKVSKVKLQDFVDPHTLNFITVSNPVCMEILRKVDQLPEHLSGQFEVSQGLIPYDRYSGHSQEMIRGRIWHSSHKLDHDYLPELTGKDIGIYGYKWRGGRWLKYGPWLAAPRHFRFFSEPRVLVQATRNLSLTQRVVATYCEEAFVNTTVINNILGQSALHLHFLTAWLNSKLLNCYYAWKHPATIHVYPSHLRALPLPSLNNKELSEIGTLVNEMIEVIDEVPTKIPDLVALVTNSAVKYRRAAAIQNELDEIFFRALQLSRTEIEIVISHFTREE